MGHIRNLDYNAERTVHYEDQAQEVSKKNSIINSAGISCDTLAKSMVALCPCLETSMKLNLKVVN